MAARLLDGNRISAEIRSEIKEELEAQRPHRTPPCLAVVLCSDDPASHIYVQRKREACAEVGITSLLVRPFEGGIENWHDPMGHLLSTVRWLNDDPSIHGVLVQLPLPKLLDQHRVFDTIEPYKDVDVFSPQNVGLLLQGRPRFVPCTPAGIQELLTRSGIQIAGRRVCIINRSDVVGKPLHALLVQDDEKANATVTLCHDRTPPELLKSARLESDIIVVAVGKSGFLTADMVPEGGVVVDVGINRISGTKRIVGDVDFGPVSEKASAISPVPGGVGPMTVTMLLRNTVLAQKNLFYRAPSKA